MPTQQILDTRTTNASIAAHLRHIHNVVFPRCRALLLRADKRLSDSIGLELASTQRILDPDAFDHRAIKFAVA